MSNTIGRYATVAIILVMFALMVSSIVRKSPTVDEQAHLFRGYAYLQTGADDFLLGHPLLASAVSALPLLSEKPNLPVDHIGWQKRNWSLAADAFMWRSGNNPQKLIFLGRLPVIWATLLLLALCARWASEIAGKKAALFVMVLVAFDPNFIAHGRLITGDLWLTLGGLTAVYAFWKLDKSAINEWKTILLLGLGLAIAAGAKFNAGLLIPMLGAIALWLAVQRRTIKPLLTLAFGGLIAWVFLWIGYKFDFSPLPAGAFWDDLFWQFESLGKPHGAYLLGEQSATGWWYYFPVAILLKTPLPTLLLLILALVSQVFHKSKIVVWTLIPALIYLACSMLANLNIGYRHLLPLLPFVYIWIGVQLGGKKTAVSTATPIFLGLLMLGTLIVWPNYIPYFNQLAGNETSRWQALSDSNVDWGQDLPALAAWQQADGRKLNLSYFGSAHATAYGLDFNRMPTWEPSPERERPLRQVFSPAAPAPGVYAISVTNLHGVVLGDRHNMFAYFRDKEPIERIGQSIFIYEVKSTGEPVNVVFSGVEPQTVSAKTVAAFGSNDLQIRWANTTSALIVPPNGFLIQSASSNISSSFQPLLADLIEQNNDYSVFTLKSAEENNRRIVNVADQVAMLDHVAYVEGETLFVETTWQVLADGNRPLKIYIHAKSDSGEIISQWDGLEIDATTWQEADIFVQLVGLNYQDTINTLSIGLYDAETSIRLTSNPENYSINIEELHTEKR